MSSNTKARVTILDTIFGVPAKGEQFSIYDRLDVLFAKTSMIRNELTEKRDVVLICVEELAATLDAQNSAARETTSRLEIEIALLKMAVNGLLSEGGSSHKSEGA